MFLQHIIPVNYTYLLKVQVGIPMVIVILQEKKHLIVKILKYN
jgi:hypothetical protein